VLDPIWLTKTETATRVRGRIESILDWSSVRGHRKGENPARWRGHLQKALPTIKKSARVRHYPALPFPEAPEFMSRLAAQQGISARALEFVFSPRHEPGRRFKPGGAKSTSCNEFGRFQRTE
jgi:hypothetical protein